MSETINCKITGTLQIAKLELERGDTLVARTELILTKEQVENFREHLKTFVPDGVRVMVLTAGLSLNVLKGT
jgi:hypothetical protein